MPRTYDPTTSRGRVRLLIGDTSAAPGIFDDAEIDALLALSGQSVFGAAATTAERIACDEILIQKRITLLDLQTDGPAEAAKLLELAKVWRLQAKRSSSTVAFDTAEMADDQFGILERVYKESLR
jgi:hypothetical protein